MSEGELAEQMKALPEGEAEAEGESGLPQPAEKVQQLSDHLVDIERSTNRDGTIVGDLADLAWSEGNEKVVVLVDIPAEDELLDFEMTKPKVWSRRYEFVRFVEGYGYSASNIAAMLTDRVNVKVKERETERFSTRRRQYDLVIPERTDRRVRRTVRDKARERLKNVDDQVAVLGASTVGGLVGAYGALVVIVDLPTGDAAATLVLSVFMAILFGMLVLALTMPIWTESG